MWAIGVIAYILLSGTMPFDDDNRTRLYRQILRAKYSYDGEVRLLYWNLSALSGLLAEMIQAAGDIGFM